MFPAQQCGALGICGGQTQPFVDDSEDLTFTVAAWSIFTQSFFGLLERTKVTTDDGYDHAALAVVLALSQVRRA
jgi:hypothetical protein